MTHSPGFVGFAQGRTSFPAMTRSVAKTPAIIVGGDVDGLGIARSLGKAGVPVIVVETNPWRPALHSRYVRPFVAASIAGPALIDALLRLRASLHATPLLFLTTDPQVLTISEDRRRIEGGFCIRLPEPSCIRQLLHKQSFQSLAELHGIPVPRAIHVGSDRDLAGLSRLRFPAVVKPGDKELFFAGKAPRAQKVQSREEAESVCRAILHKAPDLMVQEWVEGEESDVYFCLQYRGADGQTVSSFVGRKLRCWPPQTGSTASCTAAPEAETLLQTLTTNFFNAAHMAGMCSMEFKKDRNRGEFFAIEPTVGRTDWQEEVASIHGINIPLAAYCYELGLPLPESMRPRKPLVWVHPPSYVRSLLARRFGGPHLASPAMKNPCFSAADPLPSAFFLLEWLKKLWSPGRWRELLSAGGHAKPAGA